MACTPHVYQFVTLSNKLQGQGCKMATPYIIAQKRSEHTSCF